jgi:hypothetical protein
MHRPKLMHPDVGYIEKKGPLRQALPAGVEAAESGSPSSHDRARGPRNLMGGLILAAGFLVLYGARL